MIAGNDNHPVTDFNPQPAWAEAWHLWTVFFPRRSITGRFVYGQVWRRYDGGIGSTRSSPNLGSIKIVDLHPTKVPDRAPNFIVSAIVLDFGRSRERTGLCFVTISIFADLAKVLFDPLLAVFKGFLRRATTSANGDEKDQPTEQNCHPADNERQTYSTHLKNPKMDSVFWRLDRCNVCVG
jgi:hypothetical protein